MCVVVREGSLTFASALVGSLDPLCLCVSVSCRYVVSCQCVWVFLDIGVGDLLEEITGVFWELHWSQRLHLKAYDPSYWAGHSGENLDLQW